MLNGTFSILNGQSHVNIPSSNKLSRLFVVYLYEKQGQKDR